MNMNNFQTEIERFRQLISSDQQESVPQDLVQPRTPEVGGGHHPQAATFVHKWAEKEKGCWFIPA